MVDRGIREIIITKINLFMELNACDTSRVVLETSDNQGGKNKNLAMYQTRVCLSSCNHSDRGRPRAEDCHYLTMKPQTKTHMAAHYHIAFSSSIL